MKGSSESKIDSSTLTDAFCKPKYVSYNSSFMLPEFYFSRAAKFIPLITPRLSLKLRLKCLTLNLKTSIWWGMFWTEKPNGGVEDHDEVIKWKQFPRYQPFAQGIHRSPVNSPHKGQYRGALVFSLICARINGWVKNRLGDLRQHRTYYDVLVMLWFRGTQVNTMAADALAT